MTSQQEADLLLAEHQATRRDRQMANFYNAERQAGASPLEANERMLFFTKRLDREFERDLAVIRQCMERK